MHLIFVLCKLNSKLILYTSCVLCKLIRAHILKYVLKNHAGLVVSNDHYEHNDVM